MAAVLSVSLKVAKYAVTVADVTAKVMNWRQQRGEFPDVLEEAILHLERARDVLGLACGAGMHADLMKPLLSAMNKFAATVHKADTVVNSDSASIANQIAHLLLSDIPVIDKLQRKLDSEVHLMCLHPMYHTALTNKIQQEHIAQLAEARFQNVDVNRTIMEVVSGPQQGRIGIVVAINSDDFQKYELAFADSSPLQHRQWFSQRDLAVMTLEEIRRHAAKTVLVIGKCGVGKSSLVNRLIDHDVQPATAGDDIEGVTKDIGFYKCTSPDGIPYWCMDLSGLGDADRSIADILSAINVYATSNGSFDSALVMHTSGARLDSDYKFLAATFVECVKSGWENVIYVSSKADSEDLENQLPKAVKCFHKIFEHLPGKSCAVSINNDTSIQNVKELIAAALRVPVRLGWEYMSEGKMSRIVTNVSGEGSVANDLLEDLMKTVREKSDAMALMREEMDKLIEGRQQDRLAKDTAEREKLQAENQQKAANEAKDAAQRAKNVAVREKVEAEQKQKTVADVGAGGGVLAIVGGVIGGSEVMFGARVGAVGGLGGAVAGATVGCVVGYAYSWWSAA